MNSFKTDVLICGGGISGLIMAKSLVNLGVNVICIEKNNVQKTSKIKSDLRSTALLYPTVDFFEKIGIWNNLKDYAQPLNSLVICNLNQKTETIDGSCEFFAEDLDLSTLGYNLPNKIILSELHKIMKSEKRFKYLSGDNVEHITPRTFDIVTKTKKKIQINSKLLIAADGRNSKIRELLKIKEIKYDYNQRALVFNVQHKFNHKSKSYEIYKSEGPCTLVPLKTKILNGYFSSVVLIVDNSKNYEEIFNDKEKLSDFLTKRTGDLLGVCKVQTPLNYFPIISQASNSLISERTILLAETAHVLPPIGAQGLNTSIYDIKNLFSLIEKKVIANEEIGDYNFLKDYEKSRKKQIASRMISIHLLNKLSISDKNIISNIRKFGLNFLDSNIVSKKTAMKFGMFQ